MAVTFVLGRAGAGKTRYCLDALLSELNGPAENHQLILLVPEQASLQTERALLDHPDVGATTRAEVLSFRRLAYRVLLHAGAGKRTALSATGRVMVLRHLVGLAVGVCSRSLCAMGKGWHRRACNSSTRTLRGCLEWGWKRRELARIYKQAWAPTWLTF